MEQYGGRVCLRIEVLNINLTRNLEKVLGKVINIIKKSEVEIPESVLDRVHWIGPQYIQMIRDKKCKALLSDSQHLQTSPYSTEITK